MPPRHERRDDWWIIGRLEQELGLESVLSGEVPDPLAVDKALLEQAGLTIENLKDAPHQTIILPQNPAETFDQVVLRMCSMRGIGK